MQRPATAPTQASRDALGSGHPQPAPGATLRDRDAIAITVGIVLGAGIFRAPSLVAGGMSDGVALMLVWAAGALIAFVGALCYAELASAYPDAGGDCHFLRRAFGEQLGSSMPGRGSR